VVDMPGLPLSSKKDGRCKKCGEPSLGYYPYAPVKGKPNQYRHLGLDKCDCRRLDVFKPRQWLAVDTLENQYAEALKYTEKGEAPPPWSSFGARVGVKDPPPHPQRWTRVNIGRELFFSVRLEQLLKRAKVNGQLVRAPNERVPQLADVRPSAEDLEWVEETLQLLATARLVSAKLSAPAKPSGGDGKWFKDYLKKHAAKKPPAKTDFAPFEKKLKLTLPKEYKDFVSVIGPMTFKNVMQIDGFTARVLAPKRLDSRNYRRDKWETLGVESDVDGVAFAQTDHGDVFVLEASKKNAGAVYWYDHEQHTVELFAASFAGCIRRFEQKN
jgi:hypothetical protein